MSLSDPLSPRSSLLLWLSFVLFAGVLGIAPNDRATWALENALVVLLGVVAFLLRRRFSLSARASLFLFVFLCLHEIGAHYTYSKVPYDRWFESLFGTSLNELLGFRRNHYDRFVHFAGGLLLTRLLREVIARFTSLGDFGARVGALAAVMSASMIYELIEWGAAAVFGGGTGAAYLGTQGDQWDAHKDMALATLGSLIALIDRGLFTSGRAAVREASST